MEVDATLLGLQAIDLAIDRLGARVRALEAGDELAAARTEADEAEVAHGERSLQIDAIDRDGSKLEHEIDSLSQKAAAEKARMYDGSVANAKELEAMAREIENLARRRSDREDELLALLEQREELEGRSREAEERSATLRGRVAEVSATVETELATVRADLEHRRDERGPLAASIDQELLELYDDLRAHKKGIGAAALVDGVCQGCHETLSSVELDRVRHTADVPRCEHCRRILVV